MSCHPYLQWWISPCAHLLLKRDQLVCPLLLLLLSTLLALILALLPSFCITARFVFCIFCPPVAVQSFFHRIRLHTFIYNARCPSAIFRVEWLTFMAPTKGTHLFSAYPTLSVSVLLVLSLLRSTCLHTSAASLLQTVFCPFNILHRWKGHSKLRYPLNPLENISPVCVYQVCSIGENCQAEHF